MENNSAKDDKDKETGSAPAIDEACNSCEGSGKCNGGFGEEGRFTRAEFVRTAVGGVAVLWGGMTLYPVYSYLNPKGQSDKATKVESVEVCKSTEMPKGTGRNFRFGSTPAVLIHTADGQFHAFKAICTHLGCTVQFRDDKQLIWCACHGGTYDPASGKNIAGPPPKPLTPLKVAVVDDKVVVSA